jgi:hypothetical protein
LARTSFELLRSGEEVEAGVVDVVGVSHWNPDRMWNGEQKGEAVVSVGQNGAGWVRKQLSSYPCLKYISVTQGGQEVVLSNTLVMAMD